MTSILNNPLTIVVAILAIAVITLIIVTISMYLKQKKFLIGIDSENITDSLNFVSSELKDLESFKKEMESYLSGVEKRLRKNVCSVETVRFNPFKGTGDGGNQSFATAFLSEEGDGVVISSLYSREHVSVFSKPIKRYSSEYELSTEEKEAVNRVQGK